ncbi:hypothetical protein [Ruminococcus sp.]|uniref:hypothetical protein n=1 Tax=Ruminococcus sp. TaxID=41978 RepID=UPI0025F080B5|nr:hypothetical protein [Ruminococcus sp.]MBQ8966894.1 hypothetical protein [Ruminococcus sp.]
MNRNSKEKDILDTMDIYDYIAELMRVPKGEAARKYNRDESARHGNRACVLAREFGSYRSLCLRENRTRRRIEELLARIIRAEREHSRRLPLLRAELRRETVALADLTLRRRRLEERRDGLKGEIVKMVVQHRYFEQTDRRLPSWNETARDLGIALSGEELRRYVCRCFEEQL